LQRKAELKAKLSESLSHNVAYLPYRAECLDLIREARERVVLPAAAGTGREGTNVEVGREEASSGGAMIERGVPPSVPNPAPRPPGAERTAWWAAAVTVVLAGLVLRVAGASGEIWFDEIWTLNLLAERAPSPFHVFWSVQHDNAHPLYGFYAWFMPDHPHPLLYRLPAIILGAGTVLVAGMIGCRRGPAEALFAMVLAAFSYPLVHYGSEARGYGPMLFCLLVAFYLIEGDLQDGGVRRRAWVAVALVGAALFHPTAGLAAIAFGLWFVADRFRETGSLARAVAQAFRYFHLAIGVLLFLFSVFAAAVLVRGFQWGDFVGPAGFAERFIAQVGEMVKLLWGLPAILPAWAGLGAVGMVAIAFIAWLFRQGDRRAPLYGIVLLVIPAALFLSSMPSNVFGRYFLFALVFLIPLAAQGLGGAWQRGPMGKAISLVLLGMFLAGSAWSNALFLAHGRGDARAAIAYLGEAARGRTKVRFAADHKFRIGTTFTYHVRDAAPGKRLEIVPVTAMGSTPPRWLVKHRNASSGAAAPGAPPQRVRVGRAFYTLDRVYPYWGLSGFQWMVYRRVAGARTPRAKP
jgi:hypothetical protein